MSVQPVRRFGDITLHDLLAAGGAALPVARYATACVSVAAAVTLVIRSTPSVAVAVFGGTVMVASMALIALVARLASAHDRSMRDALRRPLVTLAWGVVCATIAVLALLISTTFWGSPRYYKSGGLDIAPRSSTPVTCCRETGLGTCEPGAAS
jgi:hypothetical protein